MKIITMPFINLNNNRGERNFKKIVGETEKGSRDKEKRDR